MLILINGSYLFFSISSIFIYLTTSSLFILTMAYTKYRINPGNSLVIIKLYLLYWTFIISLIGSYLFISLWYYVDSYLIGLFRLNAFNWLFTMIIIFIGSCVLINSIDYLSISDNWLFLFYLLLFQLSMIGFVLSDDLLITFFNWELLGLISYLLINYWSSKINAGVKAIVFNKLGDIMFMFLLAWIYSFLINNHGYIGIEPLLNYLLIFESTIPILPITLFTILFSKSAQLPFSSWLLNAMVAPTPISSLLHSSTMVIAGVYLGLVFTNLLSYLFISFLFSFLFNSLVLITLIWSLIRAILVSDIKSIIAYSTISQISYMFLAMLVNPMLCLFHIIVHALFKSILFLLAGSIITIHSNHQSITRIKFNHYFIKITFITMSIILISAISKEAIINSLYFDLSSCFIFSLSFLGCLFTILYSFRIYFYFFYYYVSSYSSYLSFLLPFLSITALLIDELLLNHCFSFFSIIGSLLAWCLVISLMLLIYSIRFLYVIEDSFKVSSNLIYSLHNLISILPNTTSFWIPVFQSIFINYSSYFIKGPLFLFEVFSLNSFNWISFNINSLFLSYYSFPAMLILILLFGFVL